MNDTPPLSWREKLDQHESHLRALVEQYTQEATILGFLPVDENQQCAILQDFKSCLPPLETLLRQFPCVTSYVLALARARADNEGYDFWPCVEDATGKIISSNSDRERLSHNFQKTCEELGLATGEIGQKPNIAPFYYQAGIMYFWERGENAYLSNGYRTTVNILPVPSADDLERCRAFAAELKKHCFGSQTLKNILASDLGPLLVQRLVRYYDGEETALPPHLREAFAREKQEARRRRLSAPSLFFDRYTNEVKLVLPSVQPSLADERTHWEWNGRKYFALHKTSITVGLSNNEVHSIRLKNLLKGYSDQQFEISATLDDEHPVRAFQCENGKERLLGKANHNELPAGAYHFLIHPDAHAGEDDDSFETENHYRLLTLDDDKELRPGQPPLEISLGQKTRRISCRLQPGFFFEGNDGNSLVTDGEERLHWGNALGLTAYLPNAREDSLPLLRIESPALSDRVEVPLRAQNALQDVFRFTRELDEKILPIVKQLPAGIHDISLTLLVGRQFARRTLWYWKGLDDVSEVTGFYCSEFPENLSLSDSKGFINKGSNLLFDQGTRSPNILLKLKDGKEIRFNRPGVSASLVENGEEDGEELSRSNPILVLSNDKRRIRFQSGGFQDWEIKCGDYPIATLNRSRTCRVATIRTIMSESGGGTIKAFPGNTTEDPPILLARLEKPVSCKSPKFYFDAKNQDDSWNFTLPTDELHELGVRFHDLSDIPSMDENGAGIALTRRSVHFTAQTEQLAPGVSIRVHPEGPSATSGSMATHLESHFPTPIPERLRISLRVNREQIAKHCYLIDFLHRKSPDDDWSFVSCREAKGYSLLRFPVFGSAIPSNEDPWWHFVRCSRQTVKHPELPDSAKRILSRVDSKQLDLALGTCRRLLNFQYPSSVWSNIESAHQAKWLENWPRALSDKTLLRRAVSHSIWWQNASTELGDFSRLKNAPVTKSFLFDTGKPVLFLPPSKAEPSLQPNDSLLMTSLRLGRSIRSHGGLRRFAQDSILFHESDLIEPLQQFANFNAVIKNQAHKFSDFKFNAFLETLSNKLDDADLDSTTSKILSAEHLNYCLKELSRRTRILEGVSKEEKTSPLSIITTQLQAASAKLTRVTPSLAEALRLERDFLDPRTRAESEKSYQKHWTPPGLANPFARKTADLLWCLTAWSRLAAHDVVTAQRARDALQPLLTQDNQKLRPLRIYTLLSFGPELFAFYIALFDFAFADNLAEANQSNP